MAGATRPHPALEPHAPVQDTMFRALGVLRFVVLVNAVGLYVFRFLHKEAEPSETSPA